jgi:hypothetical protein
MGASVMSSGCSSGMHRSWSYLPKRYNKSLGEKRLPYRQWCQILVMSSQLVTMPCSMGYLVWLLQ